MELLFRVSLCLLTLIGNTFGDETGVVKISCKEDEDVMLPCSFKETLGTKRFDWIKDGKDVLLCEYGVVSPSRQDNQFRGRVSHFPDQLNSGNASISIKKAKVSDSGNYTCLHIDSAKSYKIELTVGTCRKPSFSIVNEVNGGTLVECEAHGAYPKPTMELQNSGNITVDADAAKITLNGDYFDAILQVVVTKKDHYHCVVRQEDICHQIRSKQTFVHVPSENTTKENPTGEMDVKFLAVGVCGLVIGVLGIIAAVFFYKYPHNKKSSDETDGMTNGVRSSSSSACNRDDNTEGVQSSEDVLLRINA